MQDRCPEPQPRGVSSNDQAELTYVQSQIPSAVAQILLTVAQ